MERFSIEWNKKKTINEKKDKYLPNVRWYWKVCLSLGIQLKVYNK